MRCSTATVEKNMKIRSSLAGAFLFAAAIAAYIGSGYLEQEQQKKDTVAKLEKQKKTANAKLKLASVEVMEIKAEMQVATLNIPAQTEILNRVRVAAETGGIILERPIKKGQFVNKGDLLCKIEIGTRQSDLGQAEANLSKAQTDYTSTVTLVAQGHLAKTAKKARKAQLDSAIAALKRAEKDIERIEIKAPISGVIETVSTKVGALLNTGSECATISDNSTMLIVGNISERDIGRINLGLNAKVTLITGDEFNGKLTYIAAAANPRTRTFRVDITVDNPKHVIRDGMTSLISVELGENKAHFIKKSLLTLNTEGDIGVRIVNKQNKVEFHKVDILSDRKDGVWVSGLEDRVNIISIGHEYVRAGQRVNAKIVATNMTASLGGIQ